MKRKALILSVIVLPTVCLSETQLGHLDTEGLPPHLRDRGQGVPTSMFGIYALKGQILVYPFFEYYHDNNLEYSPLELGQGLDEDFRGRYRAREWLLFLGYGLSRNVAIELEVAAIDATLTKSPDDPTALPEEISESGLGDVQTQVNWRWLDEMGSRPEVWSYLEIVYPTGKENSLIGTADWEFKLGTGLIRGFGWGTVTLRAAIEYSAEEKNVELGEVALEALRRLSGHWRVYLGVEAAQDEVELIPEVQWHFARWALLKLNSAFALTSKATDWGPEVGVMFSF